MISTVPLCFNSHCTSVNIIIILLCEKHVHSTTKNLLEIRHINSLVHEYLHIYVQLSTGRYGILQKCLTLTCEDKMRDVSPASSMNLKIIYRLKTSKTANLVTISIQKFYIYNKYIYTSIMYYG